MKMPTFRYFIFIISCGLFETQTKFLIYAQFIAIHILLPIQKQNFTRRKYINKVWRSNFFRIQARIKYSPMAVEIRSKLFGLSVTK